MGERFWGFIYLNKFKLEKHNSFWSLEFPCWARGIFLKTNMPINCAIALFAKRLSFSLVWRTKFASALKWPIPRKVGKTPKRGNLFKGRTDLSFFLCAMKLLRWGCEKFFHLILLYIRTRRFCLQILWPVIWHEFKILSLHLLELRSESLCWLSRINRESGCGHSKTFPLCLRPRKMYKCTAHKSTRPVEICGRCWNKQRGCSSSFSSVFVAHHIIITFPFFSTHEMRPIYIWGKIYCLRVTGMAKKWASKRASELQAGGRRLNPRALPSCFIEPQGCVEHAPLHCSTGGFYVWVCIVLPHTRDYSRAGR